MSIRFSADEVLEIAEQIERNGVAFYSAAAEVIKDPKANKMLKDLASWEESHVETFATMRADLSVDEIDSDVYDPYSELEDYLKATADQVVFTSKMTPKEMLGENPTLRSILETALEREKDSVVFYSGIRDMVSRKAGAERVDKIIGEEVSHVALIQKQLKSILG